MMCSIALNNQVIVKLIWRKVRKNKFQHFENRHVSFDILWSTNFMQKIKKILRVVSEKTGN